MSADGGRSPSAIDRRDRIRRPAAADRANNSHEAERIGLQAAKKRPGRSLKKIAETDDIFDNVHRINKLADESKGVIRTGIDAKAAVKIGLFPGGGYSRQGEEAFDHDFEPEGVLELFGIHIPETGENHFFFTLGNVTADFMVDRIQELWPDLKRRFDPHTLVINADNGPENSGSRTRFVKRIVEFAQNEGIDVSLAYYPPYHGKYNPVERVFGVLENHWRSELFDSVEKVVGLAKNMTWNGQKPIVKMIDGIYRTGIRLSKSAMKKYENLIDRLKGLEKWSVDILCFSD